MEKALEWFFTIITGKERNKIIICSCKGYWDRKKAIKHCTLYTQHEITYLLSTQNILHVLNVPSRHRQVRVDQESRILMTLEDCVSILYLLKCCLCLRYFPKHSWNNTKLMKGGSHFCWYSYEWQTQRKTWQNPPRLTALPTRSRECSLKLNRSKMQILAKELNGFVYAAERGDIRFDSK